MASTSSFYFKSYLLLHATHTITLSIDELLKMTLEQQAYLISKPDVLSDRVREMGQVFRR